MKHLGGQPIRPARGSSPRRPIRPGWAPAGSTLPEPSVKDSRTESAATAALHQLTPAEPRARL
jgi:hypothetical protein